MRTGRMRFALLGDHSDGLDLARALAESGRHQLAAYSGPTAGAEVLRRWPPEVRSVADGGEVLAEPTIDATIVAGAAALRPAQLRRAERSRRSRRLPARKSWTRRSRCCWPAGSSKAACFR